MFIYHYSAKPHPTLLSKAASGVMTPAQIKLVRLEARKKPYKALPYCDHISFFFDPIPSEILPKIFGEGHPVWFKGNKLYEHVVSVSDLPSDIVYHVVESQKRTELLDKFSEENNWVDDDPDLLFKWQILISQQEALWGEQGIGRSKLEQQIKQNAGNTGNNYIKASERDDFEFGRNKYAANVPHLMLYPPEGKIKITQINSLIIGSKNRTKVISSAGL